MLLSAIDAFVSLFFPNTKKRHSLGEEAPRYLKKHVAFYRNLSDADKILFEQRMLLFLNSTNIVAEGCELEEEDCWLVAAAAIIPVWKFPNWHYVNLTTVFIVPEMFNQHLRFDTDDGRIQGMVGTGVYSGKMYLSKKALHYGFSNDQDKRNVAIHEFAHLIDMADGDCDGLPEILFEYAFTMPWFDFIKRKTQDIHKGKSNIDPYATTNQQEFFAVATEYFFEEPKMLQRKHPQLYEALSEFYKQEAHEIEETIKIRRKAPCPCGSGKKYKNCCEPED